MDFMKQKMRNIVFMCMFFLGVGFIASSAHLQAAEESLKVMGGEYGIFVGVNGKETLCVKSGTQVIGYKDLSFKSNNQKICQITKQGVIKGKKVGTAKITVSLKKNSAKKVTVPVYVKKSYTVSPGTKPYQNAYTKNRVYNKYTRQYFMLRSYMELFEKQNGGILRLKKGTYYITNVLYIPSNVKIIMENGVKIQKFATTKSKELPPSGTIFELVNPSKHEKKGVYGKYNGVHNVQIVGKGNAGINMKCSFKKVIALVMGHNKNVVIEGITFENNNIGHFIEMDASCNVIVRNCKFQKGKINYDMAAEAINLDTPDKKTKGFVHDWSKYDCTANKNVLISNCDFNGLARAIGTHQYSFKKYHTNIQIRNCTFRNIACGGIQIMNWKDAVIKDCSFMNIGKKKNGSYYHKTLSTTVRAIVVRGGTSKLSVSGCKFSNMPRVMQCMPWKNQNTNYPIIYNKIIEEEYKKIAAENTLGKGVDLPYIIVNDKYNVFDHAERFYF